MNSSLMAYSWEVDSNFQINYYPDNENQVLNLEFILKNNAHGWMGLCFNHFMFPADCIVAWMDDNGNPRALDLYNPGIPNFENFPAPLQDTNPQIITDMNSEFAIYNNKDNLINLSGEISKDTITIRVSRKYITRDIFDFQIHPEKEFSVVAAYNTEIGWNPAYNASQATHNSIGSAKWKLK